MSIKSRPASSRVPDSEKSLLALIPYGSPELGRGGLILLCLLVRIAALRADPPRWLSWSTGIYTDEGFYTLDARHEALFGTPAPGTFHDRLLSPLLSLIQQGVFDTFGAGLLQARLLSVFFGLLTTAVFWLGLRRAYGNRTADFGALLLGLAPPFVFYNRLALQETPTVFWLVLAFTLWAYAGAAAKYASGAALAIAVVFKSLAVIALPVLLIAPPAPNSGGAGVPSKPNPTPAVLGALGILLLYLALWYWPHHTELLRMATYYRMHQMQPHSAFSLWLNLRRGVIGGERGVLPYLMAFLPVPCLLAGWQIVRGRLALPADKYLGVWLACGLVFCLLSSYAPSRYYVLFLPPLAGLAARGLSGCKPPLRLMSMLLFCLTSLGWYGAAWADRTETRQAASRNLVRLLPPGSIVIGEFAPILCLDTPFAAAPVQPGLSNDNQPVERLHASAIAVTRTAFWQSWWQDRYPGIIQPSHKIASVTLGGARSYSIDIYSVRGTEK